MDVDIEGEIRVLHVDDEPELSALTADLLRRESDAFRVVTAADGPEGLEKLTSHEIDCVVSDFDMPGMNGIELLDEVRRRRPALPFILFTGKGSEEVASEAISAGVDDYLQKSAAPEQYELLAKRITNAVQKDRSRRAAAKTRRFFSTLIEQSTDVIPVIRRDGTISYISPSSEWRLGYEPDELTGENAFDYIHPEDVEDASEKFLEAIENPNSMPEVEFRFKHGDGSWIALHGRARNLLDDPDVGGIVAYNRIAPRANSRSAGPSPDSDQRETSPRF